MIGGRVLDTSAILDVAQSRSLYGQALLWTALQAGLAVAVPAAALQSAWQHAADTDAERLEHLVGLPVVVVLGLDAVTARSAGRLAAVAGQPAAPVGTVQAVQVARERGWPVVTRDVEQVLALDPHVPFESLP